MFKYDHSCSICGLIFTSRFPEPPTRGPCGHTGIKRKFSTFGLVTSYDGGFNHSVGGYVANRYEHSEALKRASHEASEQLGMEHRYVPIDPRELKEATCTDE